MSDARQYRASYTISRFHLSDAKFRGILGPVGSGKSTACCWEIYRRANEQQPNAAGIRKTRWTVIRNTYRELKDTTIKTWLDWFPEDVCGAFNWSDMAHKVKFGDVEFEVMFRALDKPKDVKKVLSLEVTGAWVNEAREIPKSIIDALDDRVGRFPARKDGGCTWRGIIADTNPPDDDHWWFNMAEVERPDGWEFFRQPGGLVEREGKFYANPNAENLENLEADYYINRKAGKSLDHVRVYYAAQYGFTIDGKPVYTEYADATHCAEKDIPVVKNLPVYIGIDFGLTPAAVFGQRLPNGRWIWVDELVTEDMGISRFAELLLPKMNEDFAGHDFIITGDPAGEQRAPTDEKTVFQILKGKGVPALPAETNDFTLRRESVATALNRMVDGKPGLIISPKCKVLRKGMAGGYCYKRLQVVGQERYHEKPDKNKFSHVCEAGQYLMIGGGEGKTVLSGGNQKKKKKWRPPQTQSASRWF